ncbi:MAG: hypothetical protein A4S09_02205 [Proteobacteria bacterium SG_bin7]|nr:MAG: hypothetical protein A4S09_02205 [Proteobacteria bacterium SG_bin7]
MGEVLNPVASVLTFGLSDVAQGNSLGAGQVQALGDITEPLTGKQAAQDALNAQAAAANDANATQKYIYQQQREDQQPWREAGVGAIGQMQGQDFQRDFTMADFMADPGYNFRMQEGMKALERSASARGGLNSGRTMKELMRFGQENASNEYSNAYDRFNNDRTNRFNRLASLAGMGQTSQGQIGQAAMNYGNNVSANQIGMGNAIASSHIAQANRMTNLLGQGLQAGAYAMRPRPANTGKYRQQVSLIGILEILDS